MIFSDEIMSLLRNLAREAFDKGEVPVSAVIFDKDQNIVAASGNLRQFSMNVLGHAEVLSILEAERKVGDWRLNGYCMLVNLEPCTMCSAIIRESRLDKVYFLIDKSDSEHLIDINSEYVDGYENDKVFFRSLLASFFDNMR